MPHIHTEKNQHDLTVTAFIVRLDRPEPQVLLHMHKKLHMLLPFGGHVELHETPWQAIAHELTEESGYTLDELELLQPPSRIKKLSSVVQHPYPVATNTHDIPTDHFHTDLQYAFVTYSDSKLEVQNGESLDIRWLTNDELNKLNENQVFTNTKEIYQFILGEALKSWEKVPTSDFILEFPEEYLS